MSKPQLPALRNAVLVRPGVFYGASWSKEGVSGPIPVAERPAAGRGSPSYRRATW